MKVTTARRTVRRYIFEAQGRGQTVTDFSNGCLRPPDIICIGAPDRTAVRVGIEKDQLLSHRIFVPCRKCPVCLKLRAKRWAAKASTETRIAPRTWFGTLTVRPEDRFKAKVETEIRLSKSGVAFRELPPDEQFQELGKTLQEEVTKWLKRVRKNAKARFRYILVVEKHKDGFPHFHLLLHETGADRVPKKILENAWRIGFSQFRLVDSKSSAPWYVCKYLTKSSLMRVRASQHYGPTAVGLLAERVLEATRCLTEAAAKSACEKSVIDV